MNSTHLLEGALTAHSFRVLVRWYLSLVVQKEIQDVIFTEAPAAPDSVADDDSFPREPVDGLDVNFEQFCYL